ncbi:MAG: DUF4214 domain-containing protein [Saccharofermentans sp.]|nr:DUF4214 domain-containing protein [Saccharofermentans sp.]
MQINLTKRATAFILTLSIMLGMMVALIPSRTVQASTTGTIINVSSSVNVRSEPTSVSSLVTTLALGSSVTILDTVSADDSDKSGYSTWNKISFIKGGTSYTGYVASHFVKENPDAVEITDSDFEKSISSFPDSYKPYLRSLHQEHPSWTFTPVNTNIDWYTALNNETQLGHSLIENTVTNSWKSTAEGAYNPSTGSFVVFDSPNWVNASRGIVSYYMDPRNSLTSSAIFQFLDLSYKENTLSAETVEGVLANTFMAQTKGTATDLDGEQVFYNQLFIEAGNISHVNPVFLAAKTVQEVGNNGSTSSNGTTGFYNFYNIGAYSNVFNAAVVGLGFAQTGTGDPVFNETYLIPWNSQGRSIVGGAKWISDHYINVGQNTIYFMRFNFNPDSIYSAGKHQYMTATQAATSESSKIYSAFLKAGLLNSNLNFAIPVYINMPASACPMPTATNSTQLSIRVSYNIILGRDPSESELVAAAGIIRTSSPIYMLDSILFGLEFASKGVSDEAFLKTAYRALTGLDISSEDIAKYQAILNSQHSRKYVFGEMANTDATKAYFRTFDLEAGTYTVEQSEEIAYTQRASFVSELYVRFLGREPDRTGLETWTSFISNGYSGPQVAAYLFNSAEYMSKNISNEDFVTQLYQKCLGREPDASGFQTWVDMLNNHASRDYVLSGFLNSYEFSLTCAQYGVSSDPYTPTGPQYMLYPNPEKIGLFVTFLYNSTLERDPDPQGYNNWINEISNGMSGEKVAIGFIFSAEMTNKNLSNEDFVRILYQAFLGRSPDPAGFQTWVDQLNGGASRESVFYGFVYSTEFTNKCLDAGFKPYDSFSF